MQALLIDSKHMKNSSIIYQLSAILLFTIVTSCNPNYDMPGMFNGSSVRADKRFDQSMAYNEAHGYTHLYVPEDYRIYVGTDTHVDSTMYNWTTFLNAYTSDPTAPFALHLGDLVNADSNHDPFFASLPKNDTVFFAVGNHDLYFNQWETYRKHVPTSTYWFDTRRIDGTPLDLFICVDSGEGTLGVEPMKWLKATLAEKSTEGYRHIVVFSHTHMFKQDDSQGHTSNYPIEETYDLTSLFTKYHVTAYWAGHDHSREVTHYGGVTYIVVDALLDPAEKPFYMIASMGKQIVYDFVAVKK